MPNFITLVNNAETYSLEIESTTDTDANTYQLEVSYTIDDYPIATIKTYYITA